MEKLLEMKERLIFILLSSKSSGSTALQSFLHINYGVQVARRTEHFESETLYWTKAASILGLAQEPMHRSVIPYSKKGATLSLGKFLASNEVITDINDLNKEKLFELFFEFTQKTGTNVIEKSPHHLYNESNIQLILEFKEYIKDRATVILLGLVRNPLDTIFSAWHRWGYNCLAFEREWLISYRNLDGLIRGTTGIKILRYEDLVVSTEEFDHYLAENCGLKRISSEFRLNSDSVGRWKLVPDFCHSLGAETAQLANRFQYDQGLVNSNARLFVWSFSEYCNQLKFHLRASRKRLKSIFTRS